MTQNDAESLIETKKNICLFCILPFFYYFCILFTNEMRRGLLYLTILSAVLCSCSTGQADKDEASYQSIDTIPMLIMQIQKCSRLYTAEYRIHKIVTHEDVLRLKGNILKQDFNIRLPLGDRKIAIPMDVTMKAYIDFEGFSGRNISRAGRHITVTLPDPKVELTSSKINQKEIKQFVSIARPRFSDAEMADYEQQGRAAVMANIMKTGIIETARANAARILIPMLQQMGYREQDITVTFRKEFGERDVNTLIDKTTTGK